MSNNRKMKILVYGGTGLLGSALVSGFKDEFEMIAPSHKEIDITDFYSLQENILQINPDLIIYAAGIANVDRCEEDKDLAYLLNSKVPETIAKEATGLNIPVYFFSTDAVFDGSKNDAPYKEHDKVNPFSLYGKTKLAGEEAVFKNSSKNVIARIIMPFTHFYPRKTDFARQAVEKLSKNESFTGIVDQIINPIYMDYLTHALLKLITSNSQGIYHIGATDSDSNYNILKRLAQILGLSTKLLLPITLETFLKNKKAIRAKYCWLDVSKFQKEFGEEILHDLDTSLKDFARGYRSE